MIFRRGKKEEEESEEDSNKKTKKDEEELIWDKKRLLIGIGIILIVIIGTWEIKGRYYPDTNILGESTIKNVSDLEKPDIQSPGLDLQSRVNSTINEVRGSVENLDPEEVASSSPQIQKVLRDIQGIKNLPTDKARDACYRICSGI